MGRNVRVYKTGYNPAPGITRGCHLGFRTNRVLFVSFRLIFCFFLCLVFSFSGTMHPVW